MTQLSLNYSFEEMTATGHADLQDINRKEAGAYLANLTDLAKFIAEPLREKYGAYHINCAFRGPELNKAVGGVPSSQHCLGQAMDISRADWTWEALDEVANWIKKESGLKFGQVIREDHGGAVWLHVSTGTRCEALDYKDGKYSVRG